MKGGIYSDDKCPTCGQEVKDGYFEYRCKCGSLIMALSEANLDAAVKRHQCPTKCPKKQGASS